MQIKELFVCNQGPPGTGDISSLLMLLDTWKYLAIVLISMDLSVNVCLLQSFYPGKVNVHFLKFTVHS